MVLRPFLYTTGPTSLHGLEAVLICTTLELACVLSSCMLHHFVIPVDIYYGCENRVIATDTASCLEQEQTMSTNTTYRKK